MILQLNFPPPGAAPDVLDLWRLAPEPAQVETVAEDTTVWRADLPARPGQAGAALLLEAEALRRAQLALPLADWRLAQVSRAGEAPGLAPRQVTPVSYGLAEPFVQQPWYKLSQPGAAERQLAAQLVALERAPAAPQAFAFGSPWVDLEALSAQANEFLGRLRRALSDFAWVESAVGERLLARTVVSWSGDFETRWGEGLSAAQRREHQSTLRIAIETRQTWLRIGLIAAVGAARLSASLASGLGALAAIPITIKFIRDIISEYQRLA